VLILDPTALERVMSVSASYLPAGAIGRDPVLYTPEMSRQAQGMPTWAALKPLGHSGLTALAESRVARAQLAPIHSSSLQSLCEVGKEATAHWPGSLACAHRHCDPAIAKMRRRYGSICRVNDISRSRASIALSPNSGRRSGSAAMTAE
jgi:glutamate/tyrosine decarboxylase-like PLP-dependent enzyme